jgi:hypothetical protein
MKKGPNLLKSVAIAFGTTWVAMPVHAKAPADVELTPQSEMALVIIKSEMWQPAPSMKSAYKIALSAFDPAEEKLLGGPFAGGALFEAQKKKFVDGYLMLPVKPGQWVFQSFSQQDKWALCFNARTWQFALKPGEVVYLGRFDAAAHRAELVRQAVTTGKVSIRGYGFADFFDLADAPKFDAIDDTQLDGVRAMLSSNAPKVTAPVRGVVFSPARFGTGSTLFAERKCGGYFSKAAGKMKGAKQH